MRVTNKLMNDNILKNIQSNLASLSRTQQVIAAGSSILRPSDEPNTMGQLFVSRNTLSYNAQYNKNIQDGLSYLDMADTSMGAVKNILDKAAEYATQAANDTVNADDRIAIAEQIDALIDEAMDLANSAVGGRYIYAGMNNSNPPFKRNGDIITYHGDTNEVFRQVASDTYYRIDVSGISTDALNPGVFGVGEDPDLDGVYELTDGIFKTLFELRDNLNNNNTNGIESSITAVQTDATNLIMKRTTAGARYQHFEGLQSNLMVQEESLKQTLTNISGVDIAQLSILLAEQNLSYNASLQVSSTLMQASLLNFLS